MEKINIDTQRKGEKKALDFYFKNKNYGISLIVCVPSSLNWSLLREEMWSNCWWNSRNENRSYELRRDVLVFFRLVPIVWTWTMNGLNLSFGDKLHVCSTYMCWSLLVRVNIGGKESSTLCSNTSSMLTWAIKKFVRSFMRAHTTHSKPLRRVRSTCSTLSLNI